MNLQETGCDGVESNGEVTEFKFCAKGGKFVAQLIKKD